MKELLGIPPEDHEVSSINALEKLAYEMKPGDVVTVRYHGSDWTNMNDIKYAIWPYRCQIVKGEWRREIIDGRTDYIFLMEKRRTLKV